CASCCTCCLVFQISESLFVIYSLLSTILFFFFQAEDGIRDATVTGVQTCALPILIANYLDYDKSWPCTGTDNTREFCGPRTFPGTIPRLFHNLGPGNGKPVRFADVTVAAGLASKAAPGLGVYAADMTGDGWPDIVIVNDGAA